MTSIHPIRSKPRKGRVKDQLYLDWIHTQPSIVSTHSEHCVQWMCRIHAHHVRRYGELKDDHRTVPLHACRHLHNFPGSIEHGKVLFQFRFGVDLEAEIRRLNQAFAEIQGV